MKISMIAACDKNRLIGADGKMPWHIPEDLKRFKDLTTGNAVIMGFDTFKSLGFKPLPNRVNIVLSSRFKDGVYEDDGYYVAASIPLALAYLRNRGMEEAFFIGGQKVFEEGLQYADTIYLTKIAFAFEGGENRRYFPELPGDAWERSRAFELIEYGYSFYTLEKKATDAN